MGPPRSAYLAAFLGNQVPQRTSARETVLTSRRSILTLARAPTAPRAARRLVESCLDGPEEVVAVAELLVTELVTNSIRHGGGSADHDVEVRIDLDDRRLRIEVCDAGDGVGPLEPPTRAPPGPRDQRSREPAREQGGFGLLFVDSLADRWGSSRAADGTTVWFELDLA